MVPSEETAENVIGTAIDKNKVSERGLGSIDEENYRQLLRRTINTHLQKNFDDEIQKAHLEMREEQRRAINEIVEEQRIMVEKIVNEEKQAIWDRVIASSQHLSEVN
jgi:hypothetical protein